MNDNMPLRHTRPRKNASVPRAGSRKRPPASVPQQILRVFLIAAVLVLALNPAAVMQTASQWRVGEVEDRMFRAAETWQNVMLGMGLDKPGNTVREWVRAAEQAGWAEVVMALSPVLGECRGEDALRGSLENAPQSGAAGHDFAAKQGLNLNPLCYFGGLTGG